MKHKTTLGHLAALLTVTVWGTTFISTKVLLTVFQPTEILFIRFVLGFVVLCLAAPQRLHTTGWRQEVTFALILHEPLTLLTGLGTALTLAGLVLSEYKPKKEN